MMIKYFDYLQFPCPLDCLRELIVIHKYQLTWDWLNKMALGKDTNEPLIVVQDRENVFGRIGDNMPRRFQGRFWCKTGKLWIDHRINFRCASGGQNGCGRIIAA